MSFYGDVIDAMAAALGVAAPSRLIQRDLKDFGDLPAADIGRGVYTLIGSGIKPVDATTEMLQVMLVGQIELPESATPSAVEAAEFLMLDEIRQYLHCLQGIHIVHTGWRQSAQVSAPFGFISGVLNVGSFSTDPLPNPAIVGNINYVPCDEIIYPPVSDVRIGVVPDIGAGHEPEYVKL